MEKEYVLVEIEITKDIKKQFVFERDFAEYLRRKQKYPIRILREATKEERQRGPIVEAWLYHEALNYYD